jgi:hypothetical protein
MQIALDVVAVLLGYLLGSIPVGLILVKLKTGKDLREVESGRTGGTNAFRAAGFGIGFATAILDIVKATVAVWASRLITPDASLAHVLAGLAAILGHNYSIFLAERDANGRFRLRGGAGGDAGAGRRGRLVGLDVPHRLRDRRVRVVHTGHGIGGNVNRGLGNHRGFCRARLDGLDAVDQRAVRFDRRDHTDLGAATEHPKDICRQ